MPIYEDNKIKYCEYPCYPEDKDKCLSYSNNNGCLSCDIWCKLINGKCIANYSFKVVYFSKTVNENIQLINSKYINDIKDMIYNNSISPSSSFSFPNIGNHTIYFFFKENITTLRGLFQGIQKMYYISFTSNFGTGNVSDMSYMLYNCYNLISVDVSNLNTKKVESLGFIFYGCNSLTSIDITNFNTNNVIDMSRMFSGCYSLTSINLSNLNTQNVTNFQYMFAYCRNLTSIDVSNFDTKKAENIGVMFSNCVSFNNY